MRRLRLYRWLHLLFRKSSPPKCMVHLEWGLGELESEMIFLHFIPRVGDELEIEIRNVADEPQRWRVTRHTVRGTVTRVKHTLQIDYGNEPGPNTFQSVTVFANVDRTVP